MSDLIKRKEEFVQYSRRAFENYDNNLIEESAILARKAGEVGVKILFHKSKQKLPFLINERSGFKELIHALKEHTNIPNQTINQLETLQLTGNKAAHSSGLSNSDLDYAINALKLLVVYFFESVFVEKTPKSLVTFINKKDNKEELLREIKSLKREIKSKPTETNNEQETLQNKLNELENKIKTIEEQNIQQASTIIPVEEPAEIETPVLQVEVIPTPEPVLNTITEKNTSSGKRKVILLSTLFICIIIITIALYKFYPETEVQKKTIDTTLLANSDTVLRIGIFNFETINDNPVVKLPLEQDIEGYLKTIATENKIGIEIIKGIKLPSTNVDSIKNYCLKNNIYLALFGDVTENKKGDSCLIKLNYQYTFKNQRSPFYGTLNLIKTDLATQSGYAILKKESAILMNFGVGVLYFDKGNYTKASSLIKNLYSDSRYLMMSIHEINAYIPLNMSNYEQSKQASLEYIKDFPDSAQGYVCYARALMQEKKSNVSAIDSVLLIAERVNKNYPYLWHTKSEFVGQSSMDTNLIVKYSKHAAELSPNDYEFVARYAYFEHYVSGEFETSIYYANKAIKIDSTRYETYLTLGECAYLQQKFEESIYYFKKAANFSNTIKVVQASMNMKVGNSFYYQFSLTNKLTFVDSAIKYYQKSVEINKTPECYYALGASYMHLKDTLSAVRFKTKALKLNRNYLAVLEDLAYFSFEIYDYKNMIAFTNRIIQIQPSNSNAHTLQGYYYIKIASKKGDAEKGLTHLNLALQFNKNQSFAWVCKGYYYQYFKPTPDSAIYCYKNAYSLDANSSDALFGIAQSYLNKLDYKNAFIYFKKCYENNLYLLETNVSLTYCYLNMDNGKPITRGNLEGAVFHSKKAYELNPNSAEANYAMANVYIVGYNSIDAAMYYNKAISINPSFKSESFEVMLKKLAEENAKANFFNEEVKKRSPH